MIAVMKLNFLILIVLSFGLSAFPQNLLLGQEIDSLLKAAPTNTEARPYMRYPKTKREWGLQVGTGLTLTKLPTEIVEEEINQSPMINVSCRFDTPSKFWMFAQLKSNYIANYFVLGGNYTIINDRWSVSIGNDIAVWFGHVEFGDFSLKARGLITYPNITIGLDMDDFFLSLKTELQHSMMLTDVDGAYFGNTQENRPGLGFTIAIEQPFWNDNWVIIGVKLNYTSFYYQTWLSYSTLDEYLLFPELIFTFIL
jgi:hypothetical protein